MLRARIELYHRAGMTQPYAVDTAPGVRCERILRPIARVGLYVPAGSAPLPSTALMLGVPARLAGCRDMVLCTPPRADGSADPVVLHVAQRCGITRVFKLGGAQAIAAMAYGTDSVPKCDKLFGPGNAFVTEAKRQVSMDGEGAAIDMAAGPSEVLVIADAGANPAFVAADLLSQAEHGPDSQVLLLSDDEALLAAVERELHAQLADLPRADIARRALAASRAILVETLEDAFAISNAYAPEHLILALRDAARVAGPGRGGGFGVPGRLGARSARRLLQRHQPRAADRRRCARHQRPERRQFPECDQRAGGRAASASQRSGRPRLHWRARKAWKRTPAQ